MSRVSFLSVALNRRVPKSATGAGNDSRVINLWRCLSAEEFRRSSGWHELWLLSTAVLDEAQYSVVACRRRGGLI